MLDASNSALRKDQREKTPVSKVGTQILSSRESLERLGHGAIGGDEPRFSAIKSSIVLDHC